MKIEHVNIKIQRKRDVFIRGKIKYIMHILVDILIFHPDHQRGNLKFYPDQFTFDMVTGYIDSHNNNNKVQSR